jgi:putative glutamine amidotransferase
MNIKLAWDFWFDAYQSLFPEIELFDWDKHRKETIDLMVFPGGEDVSLEFYADRSTINKYAGLCYTNRERDDYEYNILDACYDGRLKVSKIFGVCRGLQFINVAFDGKLLPDLSSLGIEHNRIHTIKHTEKNNLDFLKTVNSMHHQGLHKIGQYNRRSDRSYPVILATDERGIIPEIVSWEHGRVLGVQFHPEVFSDNNEDKIKFIEFLNEWISGNKLPYDGYEGRS